MTRILVQRGSSGSSASCSNNRGSASIPAASTQVTSNQIAVVKDENIIEEVHEEIFPNEVPENVSVPENRNEGRKSEDLATKNVNTYQDEGSILENEKLHGDPEGSGNSLEGLSRLSFLDEKDMVGGRSIQTMTGTSNPPPPPAPPPKYSSPNSVLRIPSSDSVGTRQGSCRRNSRWASVSIRSSPNASYPSSPRSHGDGEGYNSADEQGQCLSSSYNDAEREHHFEIELRRVGGLEVRKMLEDGNCLFRAVADQVYGDSELYDLVRQLCIDYMERERDHFSQFITEGFTSYCKRKRRDKVYGNNIEIQALSEMYNRPIHIYSYSTEPINTFHGNYTTDTPPIRLSYHHGNHYNSLVDPRQLNIGAGLGFSSLQGVFQANVDKDQVKAAIKAQQDQQIDNALVAEGRFYSDLELTEKEIERMVMEASRAEYLAGNKLKHEVIHHESSTSRAEPSSSAAREGQSPP